MEDKKAGLKAVMAYERLDRKDVSAINLQSVLESFEDCRAGAWSIMHLPSCVVRGLVHAIVEVFPNPSLAELVLDNCYGCKDDPNFAMRMYGSGSGEPASLEETLTPLFWDEKQACAYVYIGNHLVYTWKVETYSDIKINDLEDYQEEGSDFYITGSIKKRGAINE